MVPRITVIRPYIKDKWLFCCKICGDVMIVYVELFFALLFLLIGILIVFNARNIVKNKVVKENENKVVDEMKFIGFAISVISLFVIYYLH